MYEGSPCIYVEAENGDLNYRERYWVSVENGLLLYGQTLSGDDVVYSVKASNIDIFTAGNPVFAAGRKAGNGLMLTLRVRKAKQALLL